MYDNIPHEMRGYRQWVVWKLVERENAKPTKIPYDPKSGKLASVDNPGTWSSFEEALSVVGKYSGIGFVLTKNDPYGFIDLDDCHDDVESYQRQVKIYREFDSYSEISPGGHGLHIILKGKLEGEGRRRSNIEVYSELRYMTMTGNVYNDKEITERQQLFSTLWAEMGGPPVNHIYGEDQVQKVSDEDIVSIAASATNGTKFCELFQGNWNLYYPSQSEADYALIDIFAFYTQNRDQIARLFRSSELGKRAKASRNGYVNFMISKSFDRQLPPIDIDGLRIKNQELLKSLTLLEPDPKAPKLMPLSDISFPPGLIGQAADFFLEAAPKQIPMIALAAAIGLIAGITGRAYNISGTGLNQYILCIANTGSGKDALSSGPSKLISMIRPSVPRCDEFIGPGEIASHQGITKWLARCPSIVCTIGEFGLKLKEMSSARAQPHTMGIKRLLMQLYTKSGKGNVLDPTAYSDMTKGAVAVFNPALTILGESTPSEFYEALDEAMVTNGLLARFTILEYRGKNPYTSKTHMHAKPSFSLVENMCALMAQSNSIQQNNTVCNVQCDEEATVILENFEHRCTDKVNDTTAETSKHLWSRAHMKVSKLAGLIAVGINYLNPIVTKYECEYAINIIVKEVENLIGRFNDGDIGITNTATLEHKQIKELGRIISAWFEKDSALSYPYKMNEQHIIDGVLIWNSLQTRLFSAPVFKEDRMGPTFAIKRALQYFVEAGDIQEMPKDQMRAKYGSISKAYCVVNLYRFRKGGEFA